MRRKREEGEEGEWIVIQVRRKREEGGGGDSHSGELEGGRIE